MVPDKSWTTLPHTHKVKTDGRSPLSGVATCPRFLQYLVKYRRNRGHVVTPYNGLLSSYGCGEGGWLFHQKWKNIGDELQRKPCIRSHMIRVGRGSPMMEEYRGHLGTQKNGSPRYVSIWFMWGRVGYFTKDIRISEHVATRQNGLLPLGLILGVWGGFFF